MSDMVNHPAHYNGHPKGIECIDVIEDSPSLCLGNAIKYIWRVNWGSKGNDRQDLEKALWYIQREIERKYGELIGAGGTQGAPDEGEEARANETGSQKTE